MSVKSYTGNYIDENGTVRGDVKVYLSADFDRVTAERDSLQARLNAADQEKDDLSFQLNDREASRYYWLQAAQAAEKRVEELSLHLAEAHKFVEATYSEAHRGILTVAGRKDIAWNIDDSKATLSASAEPSAPKCKYCGDTGQFMIGSSGDASDGNAPITARCEDCELGEPKAPVAQYPNRLCHIDYTSHPYRCGCLKGDKEAQRIYDEHMGAPVERDERAELSAKNQQLSGFLRQALAALNPRGELAKAIKVALEKATERSPCKACHGEGVIHTGIGESPTTICNRCEGLGHE